MAGAVEGLRFPGKTKQKTNVFWSTVPENEQFLNVRVPGVSMEELRNNNMNLRQQPQVQSIRRSKSDSAVPSSRRDPTTTAKNSRTVSKTSGKRKEPLNKKTEVLKADIPSTPAESFVSSSGDSSRRASIKNLNVEDKKRVANLIKELAKTGEERELALERLQEERVSFEERLRAVQEEQMSLRLEREALRQKLKEGQELLKKYETELDKVKRQKIKQEQALKKPTVALAQGTQTSPFQKPIPDSSTSPAKRIPVDVSVEYIGEVDQTKGTGRNDCARSRTLQKGKNHPVIQMPSEMSQLPVYSNSLFDLKMSKVKQPGTSSGNPVDGVQLLNKEYVQSSIGDDSGLHELYLREYKLQLRLQEQQLEIQRQQLLLQQHLQLLQQQQQQNLTQNHKEHEQQQRQHNPTQQPSPRKTHSHISQQDQLTSEQNRTSFDHLQSLQQKSQHNHLQQSVTKHGHPSRSGGIQCDLQHNQSQKQPPTDGFHMPLEVQGFPSQRYHLNRDSNHSESMQLLSHNSQAANPLKFNEQYNKSNDDHHTEPHFTAIHPYLSEQHHTKEQYHQSIMQQCQPIEKPPCINKDYYFNDQHDPEKHVYPLEPKHVREKHPMVDKLHQSNALHHSQLEPYGPQNEQVHPHGDKYFHPIKEHLYDPYPVGYHHQNLGEGYFATRKHYQPQENQFTKHSPSERNFLEELPNTVKENYHLQEKCCYSSDLHQHTLEQYQHQMELSLRCANGTPSVPAVNHDYLMQDPTFLQNDDAFTYVTSSDHLYKTRQCCPPMNNANSGPHMPIEKHISNHQISTKCKPFPKPTYHIGNSEANNPLVSERKAHPRQASEDIREMFGAEAGDKDPYLRRKISLNREKFERLPENQDEQIHPGYSLYKPELSLGNHEMVKSPVNHKQQSVSDNQHTPCTHSPRQNYPSSLVQIVEHLESNSESEKTFSEDHFELETVSVSSNEEENAVLDNIFFLKR